MNSLITKHYVTFVSPGTLFSEETRKLIDRWDPRAACKMAKDIQERYGAKPYGFYFMTFVTAPSVQLEGESFKAEEKKKAESGMHFITGTLRRYDQTTFGPDEAILKSNVEGNGYWVLIENRNSYKTVQPFGEKAVLVDWDGKILARGDDPELVKCREECQARHKAEMQRKYPDLQMKKNDNNT